MKGVYQHDPVPLDIEGTIRAMMESNVPNIHNYKDRLNVGCGMDYLEGFDNLDGDEMVKAEIHCELDDADVRIPRDDNSYDYIYCSHVLEHIWHLPQLKREFGRILRPGGICIVVVPEMNSYDAWGDDTHCRAFSQGSFSNGFWKFGKVIHLQPIVARTEGMPDRDWIGAIIQKHAY
jgi:SAM-dependent methyltransferase